MEKLMKISQIFALGVLVSVGLLTNLGTSHAQELPALEVVQQLDINRYLGKWYEIASIPHRFQKGCVASTATYSLRTDGNINVFNECRKNSLTGKLSSVNGKAWIPN